MDKSLISSGSQTASAAIRTVACDFCGVVVALDGTNAVTLDAYDNASAASGDKLIPTLTIPTSSTVRSFSLLLAGVRATNGVYVNVSVAGGGTVAYCAYTK